MMATTCSGIKVKEKGAEDEKHPLRVPHGTSISYQRKLQIGALSPASNPRDTGAGREVRENEQENGKKNLQQGWAFHVVLAGKVEVFSQHNPQDGTAPTVI